MKKSLKEIIGNNWHYYHDVEDIVPPEIHDQLKGGTSPSGRPLLDYDNSGLIAIFSDDIKNWQNFLDEIRDAGIKWAVAADEGGNDPEGQIMVLDIYDTGIDSKSKDKSVNEGNVGYEETRRGEQYQMEVLRSLEAEGMTFDEADNMVDIEYDLIGDCLDSDTDPDECAEMIMKKNGLDTDDESADELPGARDWTKQDAEERGLGHVWKDTNESVNESSKLTKTLRKLGWFGDGWTPQEYKTQIRNLSDETLLLWYNTKDMPIPNTPLDFQNKLVKHEVERRGLSKIHESSDYKNMLDDDMADTYEEIMNYLRSLENDGDFDEINSVLAKILTNIDVIEDETLYDMILNNEDKKAIADYVMDNHYIGLGPKAKKKRLEYLEKYGDVSDDVNEAKKKPTTQSGKDKKFKKVMGEFGKGKLRSGSKKGPKVTDPKQAAAIAYSESGQSKNESYRALFINEDTDLFQRYRDTFGDEDVPFPKRSKPSEFEQGILDHNKKQATIELTAKELKTFMSDIVEQANWSESSYKIVEFIGMDPRDGV
jgi:hypothetical protein